MTTTPTPTPAPTPRTDASLDKMPATMRRTIDDASNTEWQLQRVTAERDQLRAELAAAKETLDWAESLLCNAKPLDHCTQQEWDEIIHKWRDQKHAARKAQS